MKKIYLVGKFNSFVQTVNSAFGSEFHVQLCSDNPEIVQGMLKMEVPDLVLLCANDMTEEHLQIAENIAEHYLVLPVLCIGKAEELSMFAKYLEMNQFESIEMPAPVEQIKNCVYRILGMSVRTERQVTAYGKIKRRVLVIDDSAIALRAIKSVLEDEYDIDMAKSAVEALKILSKETPDLIFLDYDMPECDGKETLELIRANDLWKHIPVVFLTGVQDSDRINAVLSLNPAAYILKPFDKDKLHDTMERIFGDN